MIDTLQAETSRDFRQRYQGSYGYYTVPESKKRILVNMTQVEDHRATFQDEHGTPYIAHADTGVMFEFIPVTKKLFVLDDKLYYVHRRPARMWARGVNMQNTSIHWLRGDKYAPAGTGLSFPLITAAFVSDEYIPLQEVKKWQRGVCDSVALSNTFGVCNTSVYVYDVPIGTVDRRTETITLKDKTFLQEIQDLVGLQQFPFKVVHG